MQVLAVSAAQPSWHSIRGKQTFTSIVREPLQSGAIEVVSDGIEGNDTAVHEGPIYALFAHHYDYWCERLQIDHGAWKWAHWAENITIECEDRGFDEQRVNLGEIWQIGDGVRVRVCGVRIPCSKLAWRCGQEDSWLKTLAGSGLCGLYFDVLVPGRVKIGDKIRIVEARRDMVDCATIVRAAYDESLESRETLNLLKDEMLLLNMLRLFLRRKATIMDDRVRQGKNAWKGWRKFRPSKIVDEGSGIFSFYLRPVDGKPLAAYNPGQFLSIRLPTGEVRSWSISDWPENPDAPPCYRVSIKRA